MTWSIRIVAIVGLVLGLLGLEAAPTYAAGTQVADCTFATLQTDLQAGGDWYYAAGQCPSPIVFTDTITISSNASLTANGNDITLDGGTSHRLFVDHSRVSLGLSNLTLQQGNAGFDYGGAIYSDGSGTVTITNSTLSGNSAYGGGAIYSHGSGRVTITSSTLSGNLASTGGSGGAIDNEGGTVTITSSTLSGNSSTLYDGGAIFSCGGTVSITSSTLSDNSAKYVGGAIDNCDKVSITSSTLSGNSSTYTGGGAIFNNAGATVSITSSTLSGNLASQGGAIYNNGGTVNMGASIIASSTGGNCSGTINDQGYNLESGTDCGFTGTGSKQSTDPQLGSLADNGGPTKTMALQSGSPAIDAIPTTSSRCSPGSTDQRGVPRPMGAGCDIGAYEYAGNNGAFTSGCPTTAEFRDALASGALASGGAFFFTCTADTTLNTQADSRGGFATDHELALVGNGGPGKVTFDGNGTDRIFSVSSGVPFGLSHLTLQHGNAVSGFGGAIDNPGGPLTITSSTLSANSAGFGGGAVSNDSGTVTITSTTLSGNSANHGGAIWNSPGSGGTVSITGSTFSGNSAPGDHGSGGAIGNASGGTVSITGSTFSGNSAPGDHGSGGAIGNASGGTVTITSSTLSGNTATGGGFGGAIDNGGTVTITSSTLSGNTATGGGFGGAIYNTGNSTLTITDSTLSSNSTSGFGGAIYDAGTATITSSTLSGNTAPIGAAIFNFGTVNMGASIIANSTGGNCFGAAITDQGYNLEWTGSTDTSTGGYTCFTPTSTNHDVIGQDPKLGSLTDNGGPTQTIALAPTSPAIDVIPTGTLNCAAGGTDQRGSGYPRPDTGESTCDIGAFEFQNDTTTTVTSSANPSAYGQSVTFTATVTAVGPGAGTPGGTVDFFDGATQIGSGTLSGGVATYSTSTLAVGGHTITATYGGDSSFAGSSGSVSQTVNQAATSVSLASSPNPSVFGQSVTFTATISVTPPGTNAVANPGGTVTFYDGTPLDSAHQIGTPQTVSTTNAGTTASITTSSLSVTGSPHTLTAVYSGDTNFATSTSANFTQTVNQASTTTTVAVTGGTSPSTLGQSVTFTATVAPQAPGAGTPTGTVTFIEGGTCASPTKILAGPTALASGTAGFTTSTLAIGTHTVLACYSGDPSFHSSSGSITQLVQYTVTLLYKAPTSGKVGSTVPIKVELQKYVNGTLVNASSAAIGVNALCVVVQGSPTTCSGTPPISYGSGSPFTYQSSLAPGGGYQFNVKTTGLATLKTYQLLFRAQGEPTSVFHGSPAATFTLTK